MNKTERITLTLLFVACVLATFPASAQAQQPPPDGPQATPNGDPIRELNLTPEQREKIRGIREEMREERATINLRLRETNRALEEALDSDNPNDATVEKLIRELAEAQAASLHMRISTEIKVRRVLTPEQLATLRALRQNARDARRGRQLEKNDMRRRDGLGRRRVPDRNTMAPLFPRRRS